MGRRVVGLTLDNLAEIGPRCRSCVLWELDALTARRAAERGEAAAEKEAWVSAALLEWGSCGRLVVLDGEVVGHALYAPPAYLPGESRFPTAPVAPDAVLLTTVEVRPEFRGRGLGRVLVQSVAKDLTRRGIRAMEAYGDARLGAAALADACTPPVGFLLAVGFKTVRPHPRFPRLRLDLRTTVSWREDVEGALERLLGSVHRPRRPVPVRAPRGAPRPVSRRGPAV
jgi:GNAT superfamily N-acetyltransferase